MWVCNFAKVTTESCLYHCDEDSVGLCYADLLYPLNAAVNPRRLDNPSFLYLQTVIYSCTILFVHFCVRFTSAQRLCVGICQDSHSFMNYLLLPIEPTEVRSIGFQIVTILVKSSLKAFQNFCCPMCFTVTNTLTFVPLLDRL
jgi:hypothetical protein